MRAAESSRLRTLVRSHSLPTITSESLSCIVNSDFFRLCAQLVSTTFSQNGYSSRTIDDQETVSPHFSSQVPLEVHLQIVPPLPAFRAEMRPRKRWWKRPSNAMNAAVSHSRSKVEGR